MATRKQRAAKSARRAAHNQVRFATAEELNTFSVPTLRQIAKDHQVRVPSRAVKADLVSLLVSARIRKSVIHA